jgi:hypothetical protein
MRDLPDLAALCDTVCEQTGKLCHEAIALREQAAALVTLLAVRRAELAIVREQIAAIHYGLTPQGAGLVAECPLCEADAVRDVVTAPHASRAVSRMLFWTAPKDRPCSRSALPPGLLLLACCSGLGR